MKSVPGFSRYYWDNGEIYRLGTGELIRGCKTGKSKYRQYSLINNQGFTKSISENKLKVMVEGAMELPPDVVPVYGTRPEDYYITRSGEIYSFCEQNPQGYILSPFPNNYGYATVNLVYQGKYQGIQVHRLVIETFVDSDYLIRGYKVRHKNGDRMDNRLDNLEIVTNTL